MIGIEEAYCNTMISALLRANAMLMESSIEDALQDTHIVGKGDTLGLDAKPEITISERLKRFDQYAILVTEERGQDANPLAKNSPGSDNGPHTFFVSDPTDRSAQLKLFLESYKNPSARVIDAVRREDWKQAWERDCGAPATITGAYSAITCVRRGLPICSVLLNYITQEIVVACSAGIFWYTSPKNSLFEGNINLESIHQQNRKTVEFRQVSEQHKRRFVTFLGKKGYLENFRDSNLVKENEIDPWLHHNEPGGPARILYLSSLQPEGRQIGFIVANGEKISEWIHWLPFVRFAMMRHDRGEPALKLYEIFHDRPWTRDGILMSPSPAYSIFKEVDSLRSRSILDVGRLQLLPNPSKYRSTLLLAPTGNEWAMNLVQQYGHRAITFFGD